MEIRIRRGRRADYMALAALGGWPSAEAHPARSVRLFRRVVSDLAYDLYVAETSERIIGLVAVSYVRVLPLAGQRARLEELVVDRQHRGHGVGRKLVELVLRRAEKRGVRAIEARAGDDGSARFLEHVGFRAHGRSYEVLVPADAPDA
jgi:ribosomal protein S18 acetylase RimI-like enzyme